MDLPGESELEISRDGRGFYINWKAGAAILSAVGMGCILATAWCVHQTTTTDGHTAALAELRSDYRNIAAKVDALLIDRGINPRQVVKESGASASDAPSK